MFNEQSVKTAFENAAKKLIDEIGVAEFKKTTLFISKLAEQDRIDRQAKEAA